MISPEIISRYPFFTGLEDKDLRALSMVAQEVEYQPGETIYANGQSSQELLLLLDGSVELFEAIEDEGPESHREFYLGDVSPGEVFGLSSLTQPYVHGSTARAKQKCRVVRFDAQKLRWEIDADYRLGYVIMSNATKALLERLENTRLQLAASHENA